MQIRLKAMFVEMVCVWGGGELQSDVDCVLETMAMEYGTGFFVLAA